MPTAFCALDEAYGSWGKTIRKQNAKEAEEPKKPEETSKDQTTSLSTLNVYSGNEAMSDNRSFCPNCQNCLDANNRLQQSIIEQNIWPRPRWIPQHPGAYQTHDPYNRYWMDYSNSHPYGREDFGSGNSPFGSLFKLEHFGNTHNNQGLLQLILFVLIALFIIQFFEMIFRNFNSGS